MTSRIRKLLALAAIGSLAAGLAACSSPAPTSPSESPTSPAGESGSASITWWGWTPDKSVGDHYIAEFNKEYPDIKVEFVNYENPDYAPALTTAMQTGLGPDVFEIAPGGPNAPSVFGDYAIDVEPLAQEKLGADWKTKFATGYADSMTYNGTLVALPLGGVGAGMFWINQDLFKANNLSTEIKTYADFKATCDAFAAAGVTCFTMGADHGFASETLRTIVNSFDPAYFMQALQGARSWEDPALIAGLDKLREMQADGIIGQDAISIKQYPEANNNFISGKAAIVQMGTWYAQYAKADSMKASMEGAGVASPEPFTMQPMISPDFFGKGNVSQLFGEADYGMAVNKTTKNEEAAKTFVAWLTTTTTGQQQVANAIDLVPALIGVEADWPNIGLVNSEEQVPVFSDLFAQAATPAESRLMYMSPETDKALIIAVQQALSTSTPSAEIAAQLEADSIDIPAGS